MVGNMGDVDSIKLRCRLSLQAILKKHTEVLAVKDYKSFTLGNSIEDYTLPSLNLFSKVNKLKEKASMENESLLSFILPTYFTYRSYQLGSSRTP